MTGIKQPKIRLRSHPSLLAQAPVSAPEDIEHSLDSSLAADIESYRLEVDTAGSPKKKRSANKGSWEKGFCPNPKGRPKGAKGMKAVARKIFSEKISVRDAKGAKKITYYEALLRKEMKLAADNDWRARKTVLELMRWAMPETMDGQAAPVTEISEQLSATQQAMLDMLAAEIRSEVAAAAKAGGSHA